MAELILMDKECREDLRAYDRKEIVIYLLAREVEHVKISVQPPSRLTFWFRIKDILQFEKEMLDSAVPQMFDRRRWIAAETTWEDALVQMRSKRVYV